MGSAVDEVRKKFLEDILYKVIVIGDPASEKTKLLSKFVSTQYEERYLPTVGVNIVKEPIQLERENVVVNLMFWDVAGQPQFYMLHRPYFNGADGMILVFNIARSSTFSNINNWYSTAVKYGLSGVPRILVGNKINLEDERKILLPMAEHLSEKLNAPYFETSLVTGENINRIFHKMAELIYKAKESPASRYKTAELHRIQKLWAQQAKERAESTIKPKTRHKERGEKRNWVKKRIVKTSEHLYREKIQANYKVIVIGDPTIGKNALLSRFAHRNLENQTFSAIGVKLFEKQVHLEQEKVSANLMLWVIGAVPHFYMQHRDYFNGADAIVLVFDMARSSTFYNINNWNNITLHYGLKGIPKILIGNSINLKDEREVTLSMVEQLSEKLNAPYFETSLVTGEDINHIFHKIAKIIYNPKAIKLLKEENSRRFKVGFPSLVLYLIKKGYLEYLNNEELDTVINSPKFLNSLSNWFFKNDIPKRLFEKLREKINDLDCPYCGTNLKESLTQKIFKGETIRCKYCFTILAWIS